MKPTYYLVPILLFFTCGCGGNQQPADGKMATESVQEIPNEIQVTEDDNQKRILFFGNSLTAGYGLDPEQAFPALIQNKLDSLGYDYEVINAGLSGETTAGGKNRIDWVLRQKIDIMVLGTGW